MEQSNERLEKLINFFSKTGKTATDFIPDEETYKMMFIQEITNIKNLLNRKSFNIEIIQPLDFSYNNTRYK